MANYSLEAIVLARKDLGEADRLVSFFSRSLGKQKAAAKGVRRLTSRMAGHLEPGRLVKIFLIETRGLSLITQAQTEELFVTTYRAAPGHGDSPQKNNPDNTMLKLQALFQILEATERLFDEQQRDSKVFDCLAKHLRQLKKFPAGQSNFIANIYVLNLLATQGYRPELNKCLACGEAVSTGATWTPSFFSVVRGGLTHAKCASPGPGNFSLNRESLHLMRKMLEESVEQLLNVPRKTALISQISGIIRPFFEQSSDKHYKSAWINDKLINK